MDYVPMTESWHNLAPLVQPQLDAAYAAGRRAGQAERDALLHEAVAHLRWWQAEHGCCAGYSDDLIQQIDRALLQEGK
jgi:hypothetical protein